MKSEKHTDERGYFQELWKTKVGTEDEDQGFKTLQISHFTINAGFSRGHHWHKKTKELFILSEGVAIFISTQEGKKGTYTVLHPGNIVETKPYEHHAFYSKEGAKFIALSSKIFDPSDPDTFASDLTRDMLAKFVTNNGKEPT